MKEQILAKLSADYPWREQFHYFDSIDSTNNRLKELAKQGAPHGTVLMADQQTNGRGRLGRSFLSPKGVGIYLSILLRPECAPAQLMHLTCAAAAAMCDAIEKSVQIRPAIKWTNDLVYGRHKLSGILTELGLKPDGSIGFAIIGIGVNCCQRTSDFPEEIRDIAASLEMVSGHKVDRSAVAAAMMDALYDMDCKLLTEKENILQQYRADCITIGKEISLVRSGEIRHGRALDVDSEGALVVQFPDGSVESVGSGEVSVRGMYGYT